MDILESLNLVKNDQYKTEKYNIPLNDI